MNIEFRKAFLKDLSRITSNKIYIIEKFVFDYAPTMNSIFDTKKIEAMHGFPSYYKIRFGSYRVVLRVLEDKVIFERVLHRKDIYSYFP